jgi:hypothetical protein
LLRCFLRFEEPAYEMDVPSDFKPTQDEQDLMRRYSDITHRKLVWRRWCIKNNCGGDPELFKQEYPSMTKRHSLCQDVEIRYISCVGV